MRTSSSIPWFTLSVASCRSWGSVSSSTRKCAMKPPASGSRSAKQNTIAAPEACCRRPTSVIVGRLQQASHERHRVRGASEEFGPLAIAQPRHLVGKHERAAAGLHVLEDLAHPRDRGCGGVRAVGARAAVAAFADHPLEPVELVRAVHRDEEAGQHVVEVASHHLVAPEMGRHEDHRLASRLEPLHRVPSVARLHHRRDLPEWAEQGPRELGGALADLGRVAARERVERFAIGTQPTGPQVLQDPVAIPGREHVHDAPKECAQRMGGTERKTGYEAQEELQMDGKIPRCAITRSRRVVEMKSEFLFTSESVSEGHPDKVADQVSDSILDAILAQDPPSRVAAETLCNTGLVVLAGEITTKANVDYIHVARDTIKKIGYDNTDYGIDYKGCAVLVAYDKQSPDIKQGVDQAQDDPLNQGAGDQGLMFGYACDETPVLMPAPIYYAHRLVERQAMLRRDGRMPYLRPDAKSQRSEERRVGKE